MQPGDEQAALVAVLRRATNWRQVAEEVVEAGSAVEVLRRQHDRSDTLFDAGEPFDASLRGAHEELSTWRGQGLRVHTVLDDDYPEQLRDIREMPPILFSRGRLTQERRAIAVVGTRRASERGIQIATTVASALAEDGITVVSGLAAGIDAAAHRAALAVNGRTVAVIGTGALRSYPRQNAELQHEIAERGLVLSQFWPDAAPSKQSFPMRNAIMSGYAAATIVVEANWQSGARNQAQKALQHGRSVILPRETLQYDWARNLADRPGVWVVDSPDELVAAANDVISDLSLDVEDLPEISASVWS